MKSRTTQTARIRKAIKANPDKTPKQIADSLGINARAVHMVRYLDKKRASKKSDAANGTPKLVSIKKRGTWSPPAATPAPEWAKPKPAEVALKAKVEEIKAREPEHGERMSRKEVVVIAVIVFCLIQVGITLFNRGM
jgi:hypothetical protein